MRNYSRTSELSARALIMSEDKLAVRYCTRNEKYTLKMDQLYEQ